MIALGLQAIPHTTAVMSCLVMHFRKYNARINLLAPELFFLILAQPVYKM
jgi:hypothetical protein